MKVAMIGLGDIAKKAYLPVLAQQADVELYMCTRNAETLRQLSNQYHVSRRYTNVEQLLEEETLDAAFVHTSTESHETIIQQLLQRNVHVYVDKPAAYSYPVVQRLFNQARERNRIMMVGFNRRFAPEYSGVLDMHDRHVIILQKNRQTLPNTPRKVVFDDFIHVVDTLRFLAPDKEYTVHVRFRKSGQRLEHVILELVGQGWTAFGIMNRMSGANEEVLEVMGGGQKRKVLHLRDVIELDGVEKVRRGGDWTPVSVQRGFDAICKQFLHTVRTGDSLSAGEDLETHRLCEEIVQQIGE